MASALHKLLLRAAFSILLSATALAQTTTPSASPQLSPKAAYDDAMHPLEVTRHSIANWSDIEAAALAVTIDKAKAACAARDPKSYGGSDLIQLARLCALGQSFPAAVVAASQYIDAADPKPELTSAYAIQTDAFLRMKDEANALASAQKMLDAVPYDALTAETVGEAIDFMQFVYTPNALQLAAKREPLLLAGFRALAAQRDIPPADQPAAAPNPSGSYPGAEPPQTLHEFYVDGLSLAVLQQFSNMPADAAATVAALDAALPPTLAPDDSISIEVTRRRYALLGKPLPSIAHPTHPANLKKPTVLHTLDLPARLPQIPAVNAVTALLLFPDWCAQCIRMATKLPTSVFTVARHEAYLYGLLAPTVDQAPPPPPGPAAKAQTAAQPTAADASNTLRLTPTLVVDPSLLDQFAATDVPYLILTDAQGIVRVLQPVGDDALEPGGTIDSAIARVGNQWPGPKLKPPVPASPAP